MPNGETTLELRIVNSDDAKIPKEIFVENVYRISPDQFPEENAVMLDIGAHIGTCSLYVNTFNKEREEPIKIVAYEPNLDNYEYLTKNIQDTISSYTDAVTGKPQTYDIEDNGGSSKLVKGKLQSVTLESILDQYPNVDVLKIDVEGSETEMLLNTPNLNKVQYITIEYEPHPQTPELFSWLARTHAITILGSPSAGGYIYCHRY